MGKGLFHLVPQVKRLGVIIHVVWLLIIVASVGINHWYSLQEMRQTALAEARTTAKRDQAFRHWLNGYGGIYAPVNATTTPNPYLAGIPDRDITKPDGTPLTLINHAYMIRLVNKGSGDDSTPTSRLTSLKPIRPASTPDDWERSALERAERGETEITEFTTINDKPYLRLLQVVITEAPCLKCHAAQGYRLGDLRGGISVALPIGQLAAGHQKTMRTLYLWHLLLYLVGAMGLIRGQAFVTRRSKERDLALAALEESEANFRTVADFAHAWEYWSGPDGKMRHVSPSVREVTGYGPERFLADPDFINDIVMEEDREIFRHLERESQHPDCARDFRIRTATGEIRWLHHICRPVFDRRGLFQGRRASNYDITEEKLAKLRNEELIDELREALDKVKTLSGFLPICANCKKIRDDQGYWNQIESYISEHTEAVFSHGICPACARGLYPEIYPAIAKAMDDDTKESGK